MLELVHLVTQVDDNSAARDDQQTLRLVLYLISNVIPIALRSLHWHKNN